MFAVALILFREVLEAALVVGILAAATTGVAHRTRWLAAGLAGGVAGSLALAVGAEQVASLAAGLGQELLNAGILFTAVAMLGWHTLWMSRHGRELAAQAGRMGREVASGSRPLQALAGVVGLAVLREGSEVVLFLNGIAASTQTNAASLMLGSALGIAAGMGAGFAVFRGLRMMSTRWLFSVSTVLIALLAAGMSAHGVAFLSQAGVINVFESVAWDTSRWVPDQSLLGQLLAALIGYAATPSVMQVMAYLSTLAVLLAGSLLLSARVTESPGLKSGLATACGLCALLTLGAVPDAHAAFKVYSPYVEQGEWELEFRGNRSIDHRAGADDARSFLYELGYSPTAWWHTAVFFKQEAEAGGDANFTEVAWENIFQLTEPGQYWLDVGAYVEYAKSLSHENGHALEWKLLLEKDFGPWAIVANPIFAQGFSTGKSDHVGVEFEYALGTYYRWRPQFEPGFEAYGGLGEVAHINDGEAQEHYLGPVVRGMIGSRQQSKLKYNLGYLVGLTRGSADGQLKFELEFEWH